MQQKLERKTPHLARFLKEIEIQFKWLLLWCLLPMIRPSSSFRAADLPAGAVRRVLFLRYDKLGDMIITIPAFRAIKNRFPHIEVDVLASPSNASLIQHDSKISQILILNKRHPWEALKLLRQTRKRNYDVVIDLMTGASVSALLITSYVGRRAFRIGICKERLGRFYERFSREASVLHMHISEQIRLALEPFGIGLTESETDKRIEMTPEQWAKGKARFDALREQGYSRIIAVNISAGKPSRSWSQDNYIRALKTIASEYQDVQFVLFCTRDELDKANAIAKAAGENVMVATTTPSFLEIIAQLAHFEAILSPDTSICHVATNLDVPLLAFYNANHHNYMRWRPYGDLVWMVQASHGDSIHLLKVEQYIDGFRRFAKEALSLTSSGNAR